MKVVPLCAQSFGANTYLLISGAHALVVDPAVSVEAILHAAKRENAYPEGILLTHGHFDHLLSLDTLRTALPIKAWIHSADAELLSDGRKNAFYSFFGKDRSFRPAEELLRDGQILTLGQETITVLHTPGHTPGSVCFLCGDSLLSGDTLFADSYGRCDLWGGSMEQLRSSLAALRTLPPTLTLYSGHGPQARLSHALDNVAYL